MTCDEATTGRSEKGDSEMGGSSSRGVPEETVPSGSVVAEPVPEPAAPGRPLASEVVGPPWTPTERWGFRFLVVYFVLYTFPFPVSYIPWLGGYLGTAVNQAWRQVAPWVGTHLLGLEGEMFLGMTGSGDTTFEYVRLLLMVVLAVALTLLWSLLDRKRPHYRALAPWLALGVSYFLGMTMLSYGLAKTIPTQFSIPSLTRLLTPYGDSSPMGIVWTFMGLVPAYTVFTGLAELVGGLLLFQRRTRTLGAAIVIGVMTNVVMLNYAFDVPVKLFSSHLLLMALGLFLIEGRRMFTAFLTERQIPSPRGAAGAPLVRSRRAALALWAIGLLLVGWSLWSGTTGRLEGYRTFGAGRPVSGLHGIYEVETFRADGEEVPPLLTDELRWRRLVVDRALPMKTAWFDRPGTITVQNMDDSFSHYPVTLDEEARTLTILRNPEAPPEEGDGESEEAAEAGEGDAGEEENDGEGAEPDPLDTDTEEAATETAEPEIDPVTEWEIVDRLTYERPSPERLILRGTWKGHRVEIIATYRSRDSFELTGRGFRWINELPHNR